MGRRNRSNRRGFTWKDYTGSFRGDTTVSGQDKKLGGRTLFLYWGRRGAISELVLELAGVAGDQAWFSVSQQNELFDEINRTGAALVPVNTFSSDLGAIFGLRRLQSVRKQLLAAIAKHHIDQVVVLMSHVWTPLIADCIRDTGTRYVVIVHDAAKHPGDPTGLVNTWLLRDALKADAVVTLSAHVKATLIGRFPQLKDRTTALFLPTFRSRVTATRPKTQSSPGFLFFGRIMPYKGLPLFVEACELLRGRGLDFRIGVAGEGNLGAWAGRLARLNADIFNRWLDYDEVSGILSQYDCMVLSNIEASQSGVVALAHGRGMPVVVTPVGGLVEQVKDRQSGLIARSISAAGVADAMELFITDAELRRRPRGWRYQGAA